MDKIYTTQQLIEALSDYEGTFPATCVLNDLGDRWPHPELPTSNENYRFGEPPKGHES